MKKWPVLLLILINSSLLAEEIDLYRKPGIQIEHYDQLVKNNRLVNKIIRFSDGHKFKVLSYLGKGATTYVLKVRQLGPIQTNKTYALRIPIKKGWISSQYLAKDFINSTLEGYQSLKKLQIPIPKLYGGARFEYAKMEYIPHQFNFYEFMTSPNKYPEKLIQQAEQDIYLFAQRTAHIEEIGDFNPLQLVYSSQKKQWVLLDWALGALEINYAKVKSASNIFDKRFFNMLKFKVTRQGYPIGNKKNYAGRTLADRRQITNREKQIIKSIKEQILNLRSSDSFKIKCLKSTLKQSL